MIEELRTLTWADGWLPIDQAPTDGSRVRVGHTLSPYSMKEGALVQTYGHFDGEQWQCNNAFTCLDGYLRWQPNVYKPEQPQ